MRYISFMLVLWGLSSAIAQSQKEEPTTKFFSIKSYKVTQLTETEVLKIPDLMETYYPQYSNNCSSGNSDVGLEPSNVNLDEVVRWGKEVWKIIEENKAVVNVDTVTINVLPAGISCWDQLATWQAPKSKYYQVTYENFFGIEVINVIYRVTFSYGGSFQSKGQYLANVTVAPAKIDVMWGFKFESSVEVPLALNVGHAENPVAGLELNIHWSVKSLKHSEQSLGLFIDGLGQVSQL